MNKDRKIVSFMDFLPLDLCKNDKEFLKSFRIYKQRYERWMKSNFPVKDISKLLA